MYSAVSILLLKEANDRLNTGGRKAMSWVANVHPVFDRTELLPELALVGELVMLS